MVVRLVIRLFIFTICGCIWRSECSADDSIPEHDDPSVISAAIIHADFSSLPSNESHSRLPLLVEGSLWNGRDTIVYPTSDATILFDYGAPQSIGALVLQADNNDAYVVESSDNAVTWEWVWTAPPIERAQGIRLRSHLLPTPITARYLRVRPGIGDGHYSLARLITLREQPKWWTSLSRSAHRKPALLDEEHTNLLRPIVAVLGIIALMWSLLARAGRAPASLVRAGKGLLAGAGIIAVSCWWNFFNFHFPSYVHYWDFYHYYIGAKYFPELGYTNIYECTARADLEDGRQAAVSKSMIRDLRSNELTQSQRILASGNCKDAFTPGRWADFRSDIAWFRARSSPERWAEQLQDHGYNGTPVWRLAASAITTIVPLSEAGVKWMATLDSLLLVAMWAIVLWAFGFEAACAAAIFWGTNFPGRFFWTGGSFLRHDWLCYVVVSVALLKRGYPGISGALFAYSTLLRIFPGFIILGFVIPVLTSWIREKKIVFTAEQRRFVLGLCLGGTILVSLAWITSGRADPYREFIVNSSKHISTPLTNNVGLKMALSFKSDTRAQVLKDPISADPFGRWKQVHRDNIEERRYWFWAAVVAYLILLSQALQGLPLWASLCIASSTIPIFTEITCYYYSVLLLLGLLWPLFPIAAIGLAFVAWLTCICAQIFSWYDVAYSAMSLIITIYIYCLLILLPFAKRRPETS